MRKGLTAPMVVAAVATAWLMSGPVGAQSGRCSSWQLLGVSWVCSQWEDPSPPASPAEPSGGGGRRAGVPPAPPSRAEVLAAQRRARARQILGAQGGCVNLSDPDPTRVVAVPNPERVTGGVVCLPPQAPGFDPAQFAQGYLRSFPPPRPAVDIPPGRMIVALPARVVTGAPTSFAATAATPFGPLRLEARAEVFVDWGDGERTGPYDGPGEPYPQGRIVHRWADAGRYDVTVTYRWSATWSWGGESGAVPGTLDTTATLRRFPVIEAQARTN